MSAGSPCFGFYLGSLHPVCSQCSASRRCKSILTTVGFDVMGDIIDQMVLDLPVAEYRDTDRIAEVLKQLKSPPPPLSKEEKELLGLASPLENMAV